MTQCTTCDRPEATDEEWRDVPGGKRSDLCWGGLGCRANAVNWRERALTLSAALDEARRERDEARAKVEKVHAASKHWHRECQESERGRVAAAEEFGS